MAISSWYFLKGGLATGANTLYDFAALKNIVFVTDYANSLPLAWNGISTSAMRQGYRLSWGYTAQGTTLTYTVDPLNNSILNMDSSQPATGLYRGKLLYIGGGDSAHTQVAAIDSFTTTGTAGDTDYYVTQITLTEQVAADRVEASFGGVTISSAASGGSITTSGDDTCFKIMAITQLISGGYRASEEFSVDVKNGSAGQITIEDIMMDATFNGSQFGFDIPSSATEWFMTKPFNPKLAPIEANSGASQVYYKIPTGDLSTNLNPMLNSETAFDINESPDGTTNTTVLEYNLQQPYFTEQVDAPFVKYMKVYNNFMLEAGDPCHPSRLWISELLAPQIWSEFGGTQGSFLDINPDDGDIITGIYSWSTFAFVFKAHSVFRVNFTASEATPFTVEKIGDRIGALSHFAIQATDKGLIFLSEKGPAICRGYYVTYVAFGGPQDAIGDLGSVNPLFDANYSAPLNLDALTYSVSANDTQHKRLWFSCTQGTDSTYRDKALIYDYGHDDWWLNDSVANYYAPVADNSSFISVWSGNYIAQVFKQEVGNDDAGSPISFTYTMAPMFSAIPFGWLKPSHLWVSGIPSDIGLGASTLTATLTSLGNAASTQTVTFDMTDPLVASGVYKPIHGDARSLPISLSHTDSVPLNITGLRLDYEPESDRV